MRAGGARGRSMRAERGARRKASAPRVVACAVSLEDGRERHRALLEPGESGAAKMNLVAEVTVARSRDVHERA